jgi:hypothetical protein
MSRTHRSGERTSLLQRVRRLRYLIVLITGGLGVGGWQLKDHPVLQRILQSVAEADPDKPLLDGDVVKEAVKALAHHDSFRDPGAYEVAVPKVKIDPALIRTGHLNDVEVRVRKRDERGREFVVWDSKKAGAPTVSEGKGGATAGWPGASFRVNWTPGDRFTVDVWQGWGLVSTRHFEAEIASDDGFPLRSGAQDLKLTGQEIAPSDANQIVFESRRVGDGPAEAPRTAERTAPVRDEDTIVIK